MILADKIILLRKKSGWSQEELAEKINVSRQAVSKWEGAQSIPDLDKILKLGEIFGVSTDYLLKDEIECEEYADTSDDTESVRNVSIEEANEFLTIKNLTAKRIAFATFLCIISPICLLFLGAASEVYSTYISEEFAGAIGLIVMFLVVSAAAAIFISCGAKTSHFEYLEKEIFETQYGVSGMVKERQKLYRDTYTRYNIIGTCLCILSVIPLFSGIFLPENDLFMVSVLCLTMIIAGIGVVFFIIGGTNWTSMQKLLQEGDYTKQNKKKSSFTGVISTVYWLLTTAVFLAYSFLTNDWGRSWIVWPVAGVIYGGIAVILNSVSNK